MVLERSTTCPYNFGQFSASRSASRSAARTAPSIYPSNSISVASPQKWTFPSRTFSNPCKLGVVADLVAAVRAR